MNNDDRERALLSLLGSALGSSRNSIQPRPTAIGDFCAFLVAELPYGLIDETMLRQGIVETDGMDTVLGPENEWIRIATDPDKYNQILHWQFGPRTYPMARALRVQYTYSAPFGYTTTGSVLIGYQAPGITDYTSGSLNSLRESAPERIEPSSPQSVREARARRTFAQIFEKLVDKTVGQPVTYTASDIKSYEDFLAQQSPFTEPDVATNAARSGDLQKLAGRYRTDHTSVEYSGIASNNDSLHPFDRSWDAVAADFGQYNQLFHWPFGGISYRITKAIRIEYAGEHLPPALMVGYQGPGSF